MMDLHLEDLDLYKSLRSRRRSKVATTLLGLLHPIASDARSHLEFIKSLFPSYTDHSIQHSFRIVDRISQLLSDKVKKNLSPVEIFVFMLAAMFHDVGMVADDGAIADRVRRTHPVRSGNFIKLYLEKRLNILSEVSSRLGQLLAFIVESHGMTWEEMKAKPEFSRPESILNGTVRLNLLAILLRIGDLLDLDYERSPDSVRRCTPGFFKDKISRLHHERHTKVTSLYVSPNEIRIFVESPSKETDDLWNEWLGYLRQDILHANTEVFKGDLGQFRLPEPDLKIESTWQIPSLGFVKYSEVLNQVVAASPVGVELLASIGEGDFLHTWLSRMCTETPDKIARVRVRCLSDAAISEQFKDSGGGNRFKIKLEQNLKELSQLCQHNNVELIVSQWQTPAPFHGFICGNHALIGQWALGKDGVPHHKTPLNHYEQTKHPTEFADYLKKFEQP
jgi:hypothetical protein